MASVLDRRTMLLISGRHTESWTGLDWRRTQMAAEEHTLRSRCQGPPQHPGPQKRKKKRKIPHKGKKLLYSVLYRHIHGEHVKLLRETCQSEKASLDQHSEHVGFGALLKGTSPVLQKCPADVSVYQPTFPVLVHSRDSKQNPSGSWPSPRQTAAPDVTESVQNIRHTESTCRDIRAQHGRQRWGMNNPALWDTDRTMLISLAQLRRW